MNNLEECKAEIDASLKKYGATITVLEAYIGQVNILNLESNNEDYVVRLSSSSGDIHYRGER